MAVDLRAPIRSAVRVLLLSTLATLSLACKQPPTRPVAPPTNIADETRNLSVEVLKRRLEAETLENYSHLSFGNVQAYRESLAPDGDMVLFGFGASDIVEVNEAIDRRPLAHLNGELRAKDLAVSVADRREFGWTRDEASYRVRHKGRLATIPTRITSAYTLDPDRWILVLDHMSYPLPVSDVIAFAKRGLLEAPAQLQNTTRNDSESIRGLIEELHTSETQAQRAQLVSNENAAIFLPGPRHEYIGDRALESPSLMTVFQTELGTPIEISVEDLLIARPPVPGFLWIAGNLRLTAENLSLGLRGTYIVRRKEFDGKNLWQFVQVHISVPVEADTLENLIFGDLVVNDGTAEK